MYNYKSVSKKRYKKWFKNVIKFKPEPFLHQFASMAFALGENITRVFFIHGIGTGKTLTSLFLNKCWNSKKSFSYLS